jgi:hypothetical protein
MILPAISIRQPWAWAILHAGKDVENRTWVLPWKHRDVQRLIHASKRIDKEAVEHLLSLGFDVPEKLETGGIVGVTAFYVGMSAFFTRPIESNSEWAEPHMEHWGIDTRRTEPLPFFPCSGRLGFFEVDYPYGVPEPSGCAR